MVASGICETWRHDILEELFGGVALGAPATCYFGLCTGVTSGGVITGEPSGSNYARKDITNDSSLWNAASSGCVDNKIAITFNQATGSWGTLTHFFIANASSGDGAAVIAYGQLDTAKAIDNGDTPSFAAGALDIYLNEST